MRSISPARLLLPAARSLAEGSWLALLYAALQAIGGEVAHMGPIELGALVVAGLAWSRRRRWRSPAAEALGLPLLALAAGVFGWLESPEVRFNLIEGDLLGALSIHLPGWLGAIAFWRGDAQRIREDVVGEDRLISWAVPGLAVPWLIGYSAASGRLQEDFVAAAFIGTIFFVGSAITALAVARLEALRLSTGTDWVGNSSWLLMILGLALAVTVLSIPLAALLGVSGRSVLAMMAAPLQTLILIVVVLTAPIFLLAAFIAGLLTPFLPTDLEFELNLRGLFLSGRGEGSDLPLIILTVVVIAIFLFDLIALLAVLWFTYRRRREDEMPDVAFEERAIVVPAPAPPAAQAPRPRSSVPSNAHDPIGAYLAALEVLAADGRWPRRTDETPAAHVERTRHEGLGTTSFGRLAAAYQLIRYTPRTVSARETSRSPGRLERLRSWLRQVQHS